jgi:hypothetical protein
MRINAHLCRSIFTLFLILCVWVGLATPALAQQDETACGAVALMHSEDHPALDASVQSISVHGFDQNGNIVYARSGLTPAAILTLEEVPLNCVALNIFYYGAENPTPIHMSKAGVQHDASGQAVITDPDLNAMASCTAQLYIDLPRFNWSLNLSGASDYSETQPAIAISKSHVVLIYMGNQVLDERYMAVVGRLGYNNNGTRKITWGSPHVIWDLGTGGSAPNASLNDNSWLVVVGNTSNDSDVFSRVCKVNDNLTLSCGQEQTIAMGQVPSVSIDDSGAGVVMYTSDVGTAMWYNLVYIDADNKKLTVMKQHPHDLGVGPRVAINENGGVVEVHGSGNPLLPHDLWLNVGVIDFANSTIKWGSSSRFQRGAHAPVVALTDDGVIMEGHYVPGVPATESKAYHRYGVVNFDSKQVAWHSPGAHILHYQSKLPAVSANGLGEVAAFVYDSENPVKGYLGLGQMRVQPVCPWPSVFTHEPYGVLYYEAKSGGTVMNQGDAAVTQRGVCWSLTPNPKIHDSHTTDGSGTGAFSSVMDGLEPGLHYYVRAYAKNSQGVGYGQDMIFKTLEPGTVGPTVTTNMGAEVGITSAYTGGEVTKAGDSPVTARGVCWSTNPEPTIHNSKTVDGSGLGKFTSIMHGLKPATNYFMRAYATNAQATAYGDTTIITTQSPYPTSPEVLTTIASNITLATATSGGFVVETGGVNISARGVCWSTSRNPTIHDSKTTQSGQSGKYTSHISGLEPGKTYHYRAYATNQYGTGYGEDQTFTTQDAGLPTVATTSPSQITHDTAVSGGHVVNVGSAALTARGICWSTGPNPTINDNKTIQAGQTGEFTSQMTWLDPGQTYYVRAYATNQYGTSYGDGFSFTTLDPSLPALLTATPTLVTHTTAMSGGYVIDSGYSEVTERGVCWSTNTEPTIQDSKTEDGAGLGSYDSAVTGLSPGTTYYLRSYAKNSSGVAYGAQRSFTTVDESLPVLSTTVPYDITRDSAMSGGEVVSQGSSTVTTRGVCWSTESDPTVADNVTIQGDGLGTYESAITGLSDGSTYHVRAYATNGNGTSYGEDWIFTTGDEQIPTVQTTEPYRFNASTFISGGYVTSQGSAPVTGRGVCWSTNPGPTTADNVKQEGDGPGEFHAAVTGLQTGTVYYLRAYAVNAFGTAYGKEYSFRAYPEPR